MSNFFHSNCNITDGTFIKGWVGGGGGGRDGWEAEGGLRLPLKTQTAIVCVQ